MRIRACCLLVELCLQSVIEINLSRHHDSCIKLYLQVALLRIYSHLQKMSLAALICKISRSMEMQSLSAHQKHLLMLSLSLQAQGFIEYFRLALLVLSVHRMNTFYDRFVKLLSNYFRAPREDYRLENGS